MDVVKLVKKAKRGNKKALLRLIMAEKDAYYRLAFTDMGNEQDTMDAMSEMIGTIYEKMDQLKKADAFYSWSKTILVNHCKVLLKKRNKIILIDEYLAANGEEIFPHLQDHSYARSEQQMDISVMLSTLNHEQKEVIQLKYFHDLDYETIANITNVSVGTVKSRIHYGMKKLKDRYGREDDE